MLNKLLTEMETIEIKLSFTVSLPVATVLICFLISHKGGHLRTVCLHKDVLQPC